MARGYIWSKFYPAKNVTLWNPEIYMSTHGKSSDISTADTCETGAIGCSGRCNEAALTFTAVSASTMTSIVTFIVNSIVTSSSAAFVFISLNGDESDDGKKNHDWLNAKDKSILNNKQKRFFYKFYINKIIFSIVHLFILKSQMNKWWKSNSKTTLYTFTNIKVIKKLAWINNQIALFSDKLLKN